MIRISGPLTSDVYLALCRTSHSQPYTRLPPSHKLVLRNLHHPHTFELLDAGAGIIHFPAGSSYTGEESLELHIHGGLATISGVLDALVVFGGRMRIAEPGEFTRRAFENGRLDLASAEALHGLVLAETAVQRRVALQGTSGLQTERFERIREVLLSAMAMVEALIDFSDEGGVEEGTWKVARESVDALAVMLRTELGISSTGTDSNSDRDNKIKRQPRHIGEILSTGIHLALYGPPNAGKSSLLNRLADRNAAIVSDIPGTTRDVLQVHLDLAGYKVIVYDTAGMRDESQLAHGSDQPSLDEIERIGIRRAKDAVSNADLALLVLPAHQASACDAQYILRPHSYTHTDRDLIFYNKSDLLGASSPSSCAPTSCSITWQGSVHTNHNIPNLISDLAHLIATKYSLASTETPLITQTRHRALLHQCLEHIHAFEKLADTEHLDLVLAAEELRYAAKAVGKITGRDVTPDEILGSIFATFCIGK